LNQAFDAVSVDSHERELGRHEEARREDQEQDGEQAERGTDGGRLLEHACRTEPDVSATKTAVGAGALTMVALCFANALQQGIDQSQSQAIESLKSSFDVSDFKIGLIRVATGSAGAIGALVIARLCRDRPRTRVLSGMFAAWAALMAVTGFASYFLLFVLFRTMTAPTEATDPAALPLLADYWPADQRASRLSIFQAGAGVGAFVGLVGAGPLVDRFGWQAAFWMWVPIGIVGALLMRSRVEPERGVQDVAFRDTLSELEGETLLEREATVGRPQHARTMGWETWREVFALRSWRLAAIGIGVTQIFLTGLAVWGPSYFKRTFHLTSTEVSGLAPLIGVGTFAGLIGGGFLADRLLRRGMLRARVHVSAWGYLAGAVVLAAALLTTQLSVAAPLLFVGAAITSLPQGPQFALLLDVTPVALREQASGISNVVMAVSLLGSPLVGGLSDVFHDDLRLALLSITPLYVVGALLIALCLRTYGDDVAMVVAEAEAEVDVDVIDP
jgi:predicted MFS family arabinose efflux permease